MYVYTAYQYCTLTACAADCAPPVPPAKFAFRAAGKTLRHLSVVEKYRKALVRSDSATYNVLARGDDSAAPSSENVRTYSRPAEKRATDSPDNKTKKYLLFQTSKQKRERGRPAEAKNQNKSAEQT